MSCPICCDDISPKSRIVACPKCDLSPCSICFNRYLLENDQPKCMGCSLEFTQKFISDSTTVTFYNKVYSNHRVKSLLIREKSRLPDTQYLVEEYHQRQIDNEKISVLEEELKYLTYRSKEIRNEIAAIRQSSSSHSKERKQFVQMCPSEDCRGFLSTAWKCGTCGKYACSKCLQLKKDRDDDTHICNEDDIATAELMSKDTKPCPSCAVRIHKIDGCDQMYCVECGTAFSWNTGLKVTGPIHNPHYYQHLRERNNGVIPRVDGDIPGQCDGDRLPTYKSIKSVIDFRNIRFKDWIDCHRSVNHTRFVLQSYEPMNNERLFTELRVKYLLNFIDEKQWLSSLKKIQKRNEKNREITQVLEMYCSALSDLFHGLTIGKFHETIRDEALALKNYVNRELIIIGKHYNNKAPYIKDDWII